MDKKNSIDLGKTFNDLTVAAKLPAVSWENAVELVGDIMIKAGLVTAAYPKAMKETIRQFGPYCVIAPGIAIPHARPEAGVIQAGFALITLATPVNFGSMENDPVDIVIGLAAETKDGHIDALRQIALYFSDEGFVRSIRAARSKEEILGSF